ncbi:MAG: hypothetical protein P8L31_02620 [Pseudomonadales bacterium]|nr:hypothetical protein [Pseudomonadales bacterium]
MNLLDIPSPPETPFYPQVPITWPIWLALLAFVAGTVGLDGIIGGAGQSRALNWALYMTGSGRCKLTSALYLAIQSGVSIWLQAKQMDQRIKPNPLIQAGPRLIFIFEAVMT